MNIPSSMAQLICDLSSIETRIKNHQLIPEEMINTIRAAKQLAIGFELLNIASCDKP